MAQTPLAVQLDPSPGIVVNAGSDGRPVVIGFSSTDGIVLQRYTAAGALDTTYGTNGVAHVDLPASPSVELHGAVMDDGSAVVAIKRVRQLSGTAYDFVFERYQGGAGVDVASLNAKGTLTVQTGDLADDVSVAVRKSDGRIVVRVGSDFARSFAPTKVKRINVFTAGGNDRVTLGATLRGSYVDAGSGNDTVTGTADGDVILGNTGNDQIFGLDGDDTLLGGGGRDYLLGGAGKDDLFGNAGIDTLSGAGGNDRLFGGPDADYLYGGAGTDSAANDAKDTYSSVEILLS